MQKFAFLIEKKKKMRILVIVVGTHGKEDKKMIGLLKGRFLAINVNEYQGKEYYKALFLTENDNGQKTVDYISISDDNLEEIASLKFGQDVELHCNYSNYNGVSKWKY